VIRFFPANLLFLLLFCSVPTGADAQVAGKLKLKYSEPQYLTAEKNPAANMVCVAKDGVIKKNERNATFTLYAQNNVSRIPMRLVKNGKPIKPVSVIKNIVFGVPIDHIFYKAPTDNGYAWRWKGRARAPLSPVMPVAGQKVDSVKCWAVLQVNKQTYLSDTITIQVQ
jgi:hypothetical protein